MERACVVVLAKGISNTTKDGLTLVFALRSTFFNGILQAMGQRIFLVSLVS